MIQGNLYSSTRLTRALPDMWVNVEFPLVSSFCILCSIQPVSLTALYLISASTPGKMSVSQETHSPSSISSAASSKDSFSLRSSASGRYSLPTPEHTDPGHGARRNIHSAPANLVSAGALGQTVAETSNTLVSLAQDKNIRTEKPTARDAYEKQFTKNMQQARMDAVEKVQPEHPTETGQTGRTKGCIGKVDLDWTYANAHTSGSRHGRKTIGSGSGAPNGCSLM